MKNMPKMIEEHRKQVTARREAFKKAKSVVPLVPLPK